MKKYDLESLIETFTQHADLFDQSVEKEKEKHPDWEKWARPDYDFNLARALAEICQSIEQLKRELE